MKERISATVDEETLNLIKLILKKEDYRNISHVIYAAIKFFAKSKK